MPLPHSQRMGCWVVVRARQPLDDRALPVGHVTFVEAQPPLFLLPSTVALVMPHGRLQWNATSQHRPDPVPHSTPSQFASTNGRFSAQ